MSQDTAIHSFSRIGIVGLGLMGGSVARDLKMLASPPHVRALSADPTELEEARALGAIDRWETNANGFFPDLDLVVYATPLEGTLELMVRHAPLLASDTLITDVASLKAPVLEAATNLGLQTRYVGSHPMAGGEERGFPASRTGLFQGARVWLVAQGASQETVTRIRGFWSSLGGFPELTDSGAHDIQMAWVSHLPQLMANALASALEGAGFSPADMGPGGRDMTRLARSNPEMWMDLLENGSGALPDALGTVEGLLGQIRTLIMEGRTEEVRDLMSRSRAWRKEDG